MISLESTREGYRQSNDHCLKDSVGDLVDRFYAEARCNKSLRPRKPEGSLGRTAQDGHLDSHTAPELWALGILSIAFILRSFPLSSRLTALFSYEILNE